MKVKFFAQIQTFAGCDGIEVPVDGRMNPDELWTLLETRFPGIARFKAPTRLAKNFVYTDAGSTFQDADEVALIPPVSGG